ncbi:hypothetical protein KSS87_011017, partial [Heliosperma pusillum]
MHRVLLKFWILMWGAHSVKGHFFNFKHHVSVSFKPFNLLSPLLFSSFLSSNYKRHEFDAKEMQTEEIEHVGSRQNRLPVVGNRDFDKLICGFDEQVVGDRDGDNVDEDKDFKVLDSYDKNREKSEDSRTYVKDESEFRHPLVRDTCRLIASRSNWDLQLEGELRELLRRLKPRQVCAVLHLQDDERVALEFFYWADRQWRYRHDPIIYCAMLHILGKTKLCEGARRVLRLMHRRGIYRSQEDF